MSSLFTMLRVVADYLVPRLLSFTSEDTRRRIGSQTMQGAIDLLRINGLNPTLILDIGAHQGRWSQMAARTFPDADIVLLEANEDNIPALRDTVSEIGERARYSICLLGSATSKTATFYVQDTGSSIFSENTSFPRTVRTLEISRLDDIISIDTPEPSLLLKLDVQGSELEILKGADSLLPHAAAVIAEISLLEYNQGAPLMNDVVRWLSDHGFVMYDLCGQTRRATDSALFQFDAIFLPLNSPLRSQRAFWREEHTAG